MTDQIEAIGHSSRGSRHQLARLGLAVLVLLVVGLSWLDPTALAAVPALALPLLWAVRRYPGERILGVLSGVPTRRWPRRFSSRGAMRRVVAWMPRGGQLLARSLAVRPPPAVSPAIY